MERHAPDLERTVLELFPVAPGAAEPSVRYMRDPRRARPDDPVNTLHVACAPAHHDCARVWASVDGDLVVNQVSIPQVSNRSTPLPADPSSSMSELTIEIALSSSGTKSSRIKLGTYLLVVKTPSLCLHLKENIVTDEPSIPDRSPPFVPALVQSNMGRELNGLAKSPPHPAESPPRSPVLGAVISQAPQTDHWSHIATNQGIPT